MEKVVVITGASGGIGAATAILLGQQGMQLCLLARRKEALEEVARRAGPGALPFVADLTDRAQVHAAARAALDRFGRVDVWVNNVGRGITRTPSELTDEDLDAMMRVNVKSALYGTQEILPHFRTRGEGHLINVSSMLGRLPYATHRSAYCGAKHFLTALTAMLRDELSRTHPGITVSLVSPPAVRTDFGRNALHGGPDSHALPNTQSPEEVAAVIAWVIGSRAADAYTVPGAKARVAEYYGSLGTDPPAEMLATPPPANRNP